MRLRNIRGAEEIIASSPKVVQREIIEKGGWHKIFNSHNPIHLEIGMGKGQFIMNMALLHPKINYIGMERYSSVLLRAVQKLSSLEMDIPNLRFLCMDASELTEIFGNGEIGKIYLNFSDPWPKERHAKRRLPSKEFLEIYNKILEPNGRLEFKTDNRDLFNFAVEQAEFSDWKTKGITYDLHNDLVMQVGNVKTEYEEKFSSLGNPIYKFIISRENLTENEYEFLK